MLSRMRRWKRKFNALVGSNNPAWRDLCTRIHYWDRKRTPTFTHHDVHTWFRLKSTTSKYLSNENEFLFNRKRAIRHLVPNKTWAEPQCAGSDFQASQHMRRPVMSITVHAFFYFSSFRTPLLRVRLDKLSPVLFIWISADCTRNLIPAPKV